MRRQYHCLPSAGGFDVWDVHRLIELSRGLPVLAVPVDGLRELDVDYWTLGAATPREIVTHLRLTLDVDPRHPVILGADGRVMDGMHRVCRALLEGRETVDAVRFVTDPPPDARGVRLEDLDYDDPPW